MENNEVNYVKNDTNKNENSNSELTVNDNSRVRKNFSVDSSLIEVEALPEVTVRVKW